jgi:Ca2+-binding EF-hand superfamily protein
MSTGPYPAEWYQDAFRIPGLDMGAFDQKSLVEIFREIDLDNKGNISKDDLRNLMSAINEDVDETDLDEMMRLIDPENSGSLREQQFVEGFMNPSQLFFNQVAYVDPTIAKLPTKNKRKKKNQVHDDVGVDLEWAARERQGLFENLLEGERLTAYDLNYVSSRFEGIDKLNRGSINYTDMLRGLQMNDSEPTKQVFASFDREGAGEIDWKEFVVGLSQFAEMSREDRVRFAFTMYDRNKSGTIDREELTRIVRSTAPSWTQPQWVIRRVDELYESLSLQKDSDIDLETFFILAEEYPELIAPALMPS